MSTPSQPQTPATLESPLREHRHRPVERVTDRLETPSLDDRSYRVIRLPNQLEVLLVHDADTDKASAAMDVNVGAFSDPEATPGVAHLTEHMLFMGTKKYPVENEYSSYLSAHSGSANAYTASTSTNYYFEVAAKPSEDATSDEPSPLYGALDRFAQFFIEPLFLSSTLEREVRAVDSENKKNLQSDVWRLHQLDKSLSNPKHPYCHFSTGSLETLKTQPEASGVDMQAEFKKFHEKHYSANAMKLVVLGGESLDTLEEWVADLFAGVKNKSLQQNRWEDESPIGPEEMCTQIFAKPVMESRQLDLTFPFLDEETMFESQPSRYISHLIGHEGPGSVMAYVKTKGWVNSLSAGSYEVCPGTPSMFTISVRLTEDGLKNYKEIVKVLFQYISLLRESPPQKWIFDEQAGMAEVDFRFRQKTPASRFTSSTSATMQKPMPREWLLSGHSRLRKFDPVAIEAGIALLRPDNFKLTIVSQDFPGGWDNKEKWYGTEYKYEKVPAETLEEFKRASSCTTKDRLPELHLPHKNEFIPTKLEVEKKDVKEPAKAPKLIRNDDLVRAWFKKDDTFWVPKAVLVIKLRNLLPAATAENSVKARVYTELVKDALEEYSYDAELAGLQYGVSNPSHGLDIQLSGYNDKLPVLLEKVLVTMRDLVIKPDRFAIIKERLLRGMRNWDYLQPYNQVGEFTSWLLRQRGFINDELLAEMETIKYEDVQAFFPLLLKQVHIETLTFGNLYKEDALKLTDLVESTLKPRVLPQAQWPVSRSLILPPGGNFLFNKTLKDPANINHCIEYLLYVGEKSDRSLRAKVLLLDQITHEPAFNQLRTKEQLGYLIFSGFRPAATTMGYRIIIQSEKTPEFLESRIDSFLTEYIKTLKEMPDSEFESQKRSLITKRLEKLKNLGQESGRHWTHIDSETYDFELVYHDAAHVKALTKTDMIDFYNHFIAPSSPARCKLVVHLHAKASSPVADVESLSANLSKYLTSSGVEPQEAALQTRLDAAGPSGIVEAVRAHLSEDLKIAKDTAAGIIEEGMKLLNLAPAATEEKTEKSKPYVITNVREYRARMSVSAGPLAVKDLSEFEDLDAKL